MADINRYNHLLELVQERRSTRRFKSDPLPEGTIEKIIDVARWAPSGFHTQPWEFVAVTREDIRKKIIAVLDRKSPPILNPNAPAPEASFRNAPAFIFALCDWRAYVGLPGNMESDNPRVANIFNSSMAGTFLYMHLAATSLGLASQWYSASGSPDSQKEIRSIIGIPEHLKFYDLMILGYAAEAPVAKEVRDVKTMLHFNDCGEADFRTQEQVEKEAAITKKWCLSAH